MPENAKRIGEAASHGDLSENSEYKFALEERDFLRARLAQINQDLSLTRQIEPEEVPTDHVGIGSRVRLRKMADGEERVMVLLGPFEADVEQGIFNYRAPACQRVLGSRVGEHVTLTLEGDDHEFEVVAIENALRQPA
jgi:transcription elongation GreA/GreB family factor